MKSTLKKRVLSALLAVLMVCGIVPLLSLPSFAASTHTLNSHSYDGRYLQVSLTQTKDAANRRSKITGTVKSLGGNSTWYATGPTTVTVDGTQRYSRARESNGTGQSNKNFVGTIPEFYVNHDSAGNASVSVSITTGIYAYATQTKSNTWTLDSIGPVQSTLTLNPNNGNVSPSSVTQAQGTTYGLPTPTRTGYKHSSWSLTSGGGSLSGNTYTFGANNGTVTANWAIINTTLTLNANGGTVSPTSRPGDYNTTYTLPDPTPRTGYNFGSWSHSGGGSLSGKIFTYGVTNGTVTANWTAKTFTVTFDSQGGGTVNPASKTVTYDSTYGTLPTPERTGYTFGGWYTGTNGGGTNILSTTKVAITANQTLYANWTAKTFTVTYDAQGGTVSPASKDVTYDGTYGTLATPERPGHTFGGWYTGTNGSGTKIESTTKVTITANQTIYAKWTINQYTVTYGINGGTGSPPSTQTVDYGTVIKLPAAQQRTGWKQTAWRASTDGKDYLPGASYTVTANVTFTAQWSQITHTVIYDTATNGSATVIASKIVAEGAAIDLTPTATKTGYTFVGWNTDKNATTKLTSLPMGTADVTIYAIFSPIKYTIAFNANGGSGTMASVSNVEYDKYTTLPANTYTKSSNDFAGWATTQAKANAGQADYYDKQSVRNLTATNNATVTLYAVWSPYKVYTVSFNANGGTGAPASANIRENETYTIPSPVPTRPGYTFLGWASSQANATAGTVQYQPGNSFIVTANKELWASWRAINYTLTFVYGNGSSNTTKTVAFNTQIGTLPEPSRAGYTFIGWYTTETTGGEKITDTTIYSWPQNTTVYARWTANKYTVTLNPQGGTVSPASVVVTYDGTYGTLPTPERTGYTFGGWYTGTNGSGTKIESATNVTITANQTLYAKWMVIEITITLDPRGGTVSPTTFVVSYNSTCPTLPTPIRSGYTFGGWHTGTNGSGTKIQAGVTLTYTVNVKLYAHWIPNTYTVTLGSYGTKPVTYDAPYGSLLTPNEAGYDFGGWYKDSAFTQPVNETTVCTTASNHPLYAKLIKNTYNVTYNFGDNGGTSVDVTMDIVSVGAAINLTPKAFKSGWEFVGWNIDNTAKEKLVSLIMGNGDVVLYAIFKKGLAISYVDIAGGTKTTRTLPAEQSTLYNNESAVNIILPPQNNRTGWQACGWTQKTEAKPMETEVLVTSSSYAANADITFYGLYQRELTLGYNGNGAKSNLPEEQKELQYYNSAGGAITAPVFTLACEMDYGVGKTDNDFKAFDKWALGSVNGTKYAPFATITLENSQTMYAVWKDAPKETASVIVKDVKGPDDSIDDREFKTEYDKDDFDPLYKNKLVEMRVEYKDPNTSTNSKYYTASSQKGSFSMPPEVFDIWLECEGQRIQPQPGKKVRVYIYNMVNQGTDTEYTIYRLSAERPTSTLFDVSQDPETQLWREKIIPIADGDMLYFDTDHFSIYAVSTAREIDDNVYIKLWGKTTKYVSNVWNWILCILLFGWIWMAF